MTFRTEAFQRVANFAEAFRSASLQVRQHRFPTSSVSSDSVHQLVAKPHIVHPYGRLVYVSGDTPLGKEGFARKLCFRLGGVHALLAHDWCII